MEKKREPHIHSEFIKAWADGYKIEEYDPAHPEWGWRVDNYPRWYKHCKYRLSKPTEEIIKVIQNKIYEISTWKVGDWVKTPNHTNVYRIVGNGKATNECELELYFVEGSINTIVKATKEEVLNADNYDGSATNDDFPFEIGDYVAHYYREVKKLESKEDITYMQRKYFYATKKEIENFKRF